MITCDNPDEGTVIKDKVIFGVLSEITFEILKEISLIKSNFKCDNKK